MLHDIHLTRSSLKLKSKINGKLVFLTPDISYKNFIELSSAKTGIFPNPKVKDPNENYLTLSQFKILSTSNLQNFRKSPLFYDIFAYLAPPPTPTLNQKPMPILINNYLPSINLHLGMVEDDENCMRMLLNTGAAMNIRNISYYLWIISEFLEMIGSFFNMVCTLSIILYN